MNSIIRTGAVVAATVLFISFLYLVLTGADRSAYITVAAVLVFSVLSTRLDEITTLKFGATGVAAALERTLKEAQATVKQLQNTAEVFAQISIQQISASNRLGGLTPKEKREAISKIEQGLKAIDLPVDRIRKILAIQKPFDDFDYFHWTMYGVMHMHSPKAIEARKDFGERFPGKGIGNNPSPTEVEAFLKSYGWNKGEITERLRDWKQYRKSGTHRRPERWDEHHIGKIGSLDDLLKE